ncbi:MAG: enoyl-CoA hydratase/isomerase family protein [Alphaproteobacteria bacterium]|jgi:methylglutaconyl-CoA hydratase|nr:enoyl-CoA hydratase/isomerase family protein [Alphaproteobacteria bacterium]MBT7944299.1 enoyl-CoA hydratase/isomerase family protein [Alphaproteobacteria bacterium]
MSDDIVLTEISDGRALVTLNRPNVHNAFDDVLMARLIAELQALENDPSVRAIVLAAAGKSFSAGADLNWMQRMAGYSEEENLADAQGLADLMKTMNGLSKPIIARIQGAAFGGGVGLIACCDIAVAAETAKFTISEVKLGLIPAVISPYVVAAIGERQARRYVLTAERFDAKEAYRIGLVHSVVAAEDLDAAVDELVGAICANGPEAVAEAKKMIADVARRPYDDGLIADTAARIARIRVSPEGREGLSAFLQKRKPGWDQT